jgi:hypothetical protein
VRTFLEQFWDAAIAAGWSEMELFGCHPDPEVAFARLDAMGAVTLSAVTGDPISDVQPGLIAYSSGLTLLMRERSQSWPIWRVVFLSEDGPS